MYNYIHYSGNMSENCLSPCNMTHASVIILDVPCLFIRSEWAPNGQQVPCWSSLMQFSCQYDIVGIEHGGTSIAHTHIARYDRLWTHCHVYISSQVGKIPLVENDSIWWAYFINL
jgi:hypothetical protein